jgi:hypothetical protein
VGGLEKYVEVEAGVLGGGTLFDEAVEGGYGYEFDC